MFAVQIHLRCDTIIVDSVIAEEMCQHIIVGQLLQQGC